MYADTVRFVNISEATLADVYGQIGVYVLWHGRSKSRPVRIGQGQILQRFAKHARSDAHYYPMYGVVGILGAETQKNILRAKLIECVLLCAADATDRFPTGNSNRGEISCLRRILRRNNNLAKIHVKGRDPFFIIGSMSNRPIYGSKTIEVWLADDDEICTYNPWRKR